VSQHILIACIGNIFLGDDGFGVEAARALAASDLPDGTSVVDYGIRGLDLAYAMLGSWDVIILVDVVARGGEPGTLYLLQPGEVSPQNGGIDPHSMDPAKVLATARSLGEVRAEIYILGCEPLDFGDEFEGRMGLSNAVASAVPNAVEMLRSLVQRLTNKTAPVGAAN
jgi:hydrogenase maturation protease